PVPADASVILDDQFAALSRAHTAAEFAKAAGRSSGSRRFAANVWDARRRLGVTGVAFSYTRGGTVSDRADGSTSALVDVRWSSVSTSPWGRSAPTHVSARFRAVPDGHGFDLVDATADGARQ